MPTRLLAAISVVCLYGVACTGTITQGGGSTPDPAGNAVPGTGGAGMGTSSVGLGVVRRLSGTEYNNTVRDLLFTTLTPATDFQGDVGEDGFDKASGPQTVGATHLAAYEAASERLVEALFAAPAQLARIVTCDLATGNACIRSTLATFLPRAWRRPVTTAEVDRLMALAATEAMAGGTPVDQMKLALRGALTSAHFLYLLERDLAPTSLVPRRLNHYEIASRLSYFLWSSMPDDALFSAAASSKLQDDATLAAQVTRMLADPKAAAMTNVFAAQWLQLTRLANHQPDPMLFPGVTAALKLSMEQETKMFFQDVLQKGVGMRSLLGADYTFLDPALAQHYGLTAPAGTAFAKVSVAGTNRVGGLLGHASILMPTSGLKMTSAVKRGEWVLDNILCAAAPPPPPEVAKEIMDNAAAIAQAAATQTARQFLGQHRAKPQCAVCHDQIDPPGLALENYDPVGRYRTMDKGMAIDPSGTFNGMAFKDARELTALLSNDPKFSQCLSEKLFTFALGRSPGVEDTTYVARLASGNDDTLPSVIGRLVASKPFGSRRGGDVP
ncbi:MAG TPA: DUF1592 domain-containing protein [Polyangia bacterium]|nr:DUF1592 domain-containing protein [Polyangia bacterium]